MVYVNKKFKHSELTDKIIKAFYTVYNKLGYGFLEKVYENAMKFELEKFGLKVENQKRIEVFYERLRVGEYYADLIIEDKVIVELKASEGLALEHECQLTNYLKATKIEVGLLINFGRKPEHRRKISSNQRKVIREI